MTVEERVNAFAMHARIGLAEVLLQMAALSVEAMRALAFKVVDEVMTRRTQGARIVGTVV